MKVVIRRMEKMMIKEWTRISEVKIEGVSDDEGSDSKDGKDDD